MWQWLQTMLKELSSMGLLQYILLQVPFAGDVHLGRAFINMLLSDLHLEWETTFCLEGCNKIQQTSEKEKPIVGIFGGIFPTIDQLHHLIGLDPGCHLLGWQKCSSKSFNTTALQERASEYSLHFKAQMCLLISLFTSTSWGTLWNPAGRKRDKEHTLHEVTMH